eukprot:g305.t1
MQLRTTKELKALNSNGHQPSVVVFSGGTAFNSVAEQLCQWTTYVSYILPVSDDGGSTAEIVRVIGGPAIGDIRSRCLRLADQSDEESRAVRRLLGHRLQSSDQDEAKREWLEIIEGRHVLWTDVTSPYKHTIRRFLVYFQTEILLNCRMHFDYRNGSVGNFFFAGARLFFHSLEAAIFLFSRVARIPEGSRVLPAIETEERLTLGAQLENGVFIRGQSEISHPHRCPSESHLVDKSTHEEDQLPSAIHRVFYLASEGKGVEHEVQFSANEAVISALAQTNMIVYGMGSLYTSICPSLILIGVAEGICVKHCPKVLILNGSHDRETSVRSSDRGVGPMTASDVVLALTDSLNRLSCTPYSLRHPVWSYISHLVYPKDGEIFVDEANLMDLGLQEIREVESYKDEDGVVVYQPEALVDVLGEISRQASTPQSNGAFLFHHDDVKS